MNTAWPDTSARDVNDVFGFPESDAADAGEWAAGDLMHLFKGWTCWHGRSTGQWWALSPGHAPGRLLSADTPRELGRRINADVSVDETMTTSITTVADDPRPGHGVYERADEMLAAG